MSLASVLAVGLATSASPAAGPPPELRKQALSVVADPKALPDGVKAAWAAAIGQKELRVAAPGEPFNTTDVGSGVRHRLILAAVNESYAVVHFYAGGIALTRRAMAFSRTGDSATLVWQQRTKGAYEDPGAFLGAIRSGKLWKAP